MEYTQPPVMEYIQPVRHAFDDPAGEEQAGAGTFGQSPPPDANLTQSSWSETIDDGDFPPDVESLGTAFRLRDDAGFSTFANADNPNPTPTPTATGTKPKSRLGLVSKLTASDATKRKSRSANGSTAKNKKKKMKENPDAPASTSPIASPSNVSSPNGSSSKATSSKAKALFRKAEATPVIASEDGKRKDTTRLVRILAAVSLAAGLALGAYAMFAGKATTSPPAPTRTTSVTDAGAVEVPQSAVLTDPALQNPIPGDGLDFSTGGDFSTAVDPPASGKN